jgi:uncharacterized protein YrrD
MRETHDIHNQPTPAPGSPGYRGHAVVDEHGSKVGTVTDVVFDDASDRPRWLVVDPGPLQAAHYVPLDGSYLSTKGELVIAFTKRAVKTAPKAGRDHVLTPSEATEVAHHYGVRS